MSEAVLVSKNEHSQMPVPTLWRDIFSRIVDAFRLGDFNLEHGVPGVRPISQDDAFSIKKALDEYGEQLGEIPSQAWETSACQWMLGYWDVLVDLYTVEGRATDLVLYVRVYEGAQEYAFEVQSVHVP